MWGTFVASKGTTAMFVKLSATFGIGGPVLATAFLGYLGIEVINNVSQMAVNYLTPAQRPKIDDAQHPVAIEVGNNNAPDNLEGDIDAVVAQQRRQAMQTELTKFWGKNGPLFQPSTQAPSENSIAQVSIKS